MATPGQTRIEYDVQRPCAQRPNRWRYPKLSERELDLFRSDLNRERNLQITDYVVCRECGARVLRLCETRHLQVHGLTIPTYAERWPGAPLNSTLNRGRQADFQRQKKEGRQKRPKYPALNAEDLAKARNDNAYEARHGIIDRVVCRLCGAMPKHSLRGHLRADHQMTPAEYRKMWSSARLDSFQNRATQNGRKLNVTALIEKAINAFVTTQELTQYRADPGYKQDEDGGEFVVCRECGARLRRTLVKHLKKVHGWNKNMVAEYREKWPSAPYQSVAKQIEDEEWGKTEDGLKCRRGASKKYNKTHPHVIRDAKRRYRGTAKGKQKGRERWKQLRALVAAGKAAARPADWSRKPVEWQIIGSLLLAEPGYISNKKLAARLDHAALPCPHGKSWVHSIATKACDLYIGRIRKWVNRRGRVAGGKASTHKLS